MAVGAEWIQVAAPGSGAPWWVPLGAAVIGVLAVLAGALLNSWLQRTTQREHTRWQHRLTLYGEFLAAADEATLRALSTHRTGPVDPHDAMLRFWNKLHQITLVAPHELTALATQIDYVVQRIAIGAATAQERDHFVDLKMTFAERARADLGSEPMRFPRSLARPRE